MAAGVLELVQDLSRCILLQSDSEEDKRCLRAMGLQARPWWRKHGGGKDRLNGSPLVKELVRLAFDLILLRRWSWLPRYREKVAMSAECRCLSHTYRLHAQGRHRSAALLREAVRTLQDSVSGSLLTEKDSILKFLTLMAEAGPSTQLSTSIPDVSVLDESADSGIYELYPSSLFEQPPANTHYSGLHCAVWDATELFECLPGVGFEGFCSSSEPAMAGPSSLYGGLTHTLVRGVDARLDLPSLPSPSPSSADINLLTNLFTAYRNNNGCSLVAAAPTSDPNSQLQQVVLQWDSGLGRLGASELEHKTLMKEVSAKTWEGRGAK